jgi:ABC-type phosphate transport system substrate-binding protein/serine/threonine protein kinase
VKRNIRGSAKSIFSELSGREKARVFSRFDFLRSQARTRIESYIPSRFRWILTTIGDTLPPDVLERFKRGEATVVVEPELVEVEQAELEPSLEPHVQYRQYACSQVNPLVCAIAQQTVQQNPEARHCGACGFPVPLLEKAELQGHRGRYRVGQLLGCRGLGRLYDGVQVVDQQPVVIKEYVLPSRTFNKDEARQRGEAFLRLAGLSLADGSMRDFRLVVPWDAIVDQSADVVPERCYLITSGTLNQQPTLRQHLKTVGTMSDRQVYHVLHQVLQTLEYLHTQKFRVPSGQIQPGLAHGNLSLDTLLISPRLTTPPLNGNSANPIILSTHETEFFVHPCDLALWERLFDLPGAPPVQPSPVQDLIDLGYVAFYLLTGHWSAHPPDPQDEYHWKGVNPDFKAFLLQLMGVGIPFTSAIAARQALLKLQPTLLKPIVSHLTIEPEEPSPRTRLPLWMWGGAALVLLGGLIWWLIPRPEPALSARQELLLCCIDQVSGVPEGSFNYTAARDGIWSYALQQNGLIAQDHNLQDELTSRQPKLRLQFKPEATGEAALERVQAEQADFAVTSLTDSLPHTLAQETVAYDGLAVFVAFSYARRQQGLPEALRGQITVEQLQKLYTGQITNWRQLGGPNLPVKLYMPTDPEAVQVFEQRVLRDADRIATFRSLQQQADSIQSLISSDPSGITPLETFTTLRQVIREFEQPEPVGAIAFGSLSKVFGQCSVYPLAVVGDRQPAVQPLIQANGTPITPNTDLCNAKGNYQPNPTLFATRQYPLSYPIAVVYPRDNSRPPAGQKFADILRTEEGQRLLVKTGLVPLERY